MLIQDEEDEDEDREGDEEGYDTYEGYDEEEDDDKEDELDDIDAEVNGVTEQGTGRAEIVLESGEDQGYSVSDLNERVIEVQGAKYEDDDMVQDEAAELALSGQLQVGHIFHHLGLVQLFLKVAS
jgi:hypothetical protein